MNVLSTDDTSDLTHIEFILRGTIVHVVVVSAVEIELHYADGHTVAMKPLGWEADALGCYVVAEASAGTVPDSTGPSETAEQYAEGTVIAEDTEYPEPSSADR